MTGVVLLRPAGGGGVSFLTTINGSTVLVYTDPDRGKDLSVSDQTLIFSENRVQNNTWLSLGHAVDADSGYIGELDGTITAVSAHCEAVNGNDKEIHLFVNGVDQGSIGLFTGGLDDQFINTSLDIDFNQTDKIRLQAQDGNVGFIEDTVIRLTIKWRG